MEFKQLECFIEVTQEKSFSKAAENLFMSQPAVTGNIQKLENTLGLRLINRSGRELSLTEAGETLFAYARELVNLKNKALLNLDLHKNVNVGKLNVYSSTIPAQYILPKIIKEFKVLHSDVECSVHSGDTKKMIDDVISGKINIAFVGAEYENQKLVYKDFYEERLVLISSIDSGFNSDTLSLEDLKGVDLIIREDGSGTRKVLERALDNANVSYAHFGKIIVNEDSQSIKQMVELGIGVAFVSDQDIQNELKLSLIESHTVKELDLKRKFKMVYAKERHFSPVESAFREFVSKHY